MLQDLKYAVRTLTRRPGFAIVTIATLAIGIGANAAIFGAVQAVLLRPLPFPEPDRLVQVFKTRDAAPDRAAGTTSPPDFVDWRRDNRVFTELAAVNEGSYPLTGEGPAEQIPGATVTGGFFDVLGVRALHGRTLTPADDAMGGPDVVMIGASLWRRRFGGDVGVIGRRVRIEGVSREVVGVMPDGFAYPLGSEIWLPLRFSADELHVDRGRGAHYLDVVGRLAPGTTVEESRIAMRTIGTRLAQSYPRTNRNRTISVHPLRDALVGSSRLALIVLLCAVGFVLLIVCVNVAGLLLTRSMSRGRELAIRAAIGAGRGRLVRGLLAESLVLALAGGVAGLLLAWWGTSTIAALDRGAGIPLLDQTRLDASVIVFTLAISLVTVVLVGAMPAWKSSRTGDLALRMRKEGTNTTGDVSGQRIRSALIVTQTALAVLLLIGAGLLVRSFAQLLAVDRGFDVEHIQTSAITLPEASYPQPEQRSAFIENLVSTLAQRPDVVSAAAVLGLPFQDMSYGFSTSTIDGRRLSDEEQDATVLQTRVATPDYFRAMGIRIVRGRSFLPSDRRGGEPVAVLSESAAKLLWPDRDSLGRHFTLGTRLGQGGAPAGGTVVGIVRDIHDLAPGRAVRPTVYLAHAQFPFEYMSIAIRTTADPSAVIEPTRKLIASMDANVPMFDVRSMEQLGVDVLSQPRLYAVLLALFALVAAFLSALGLYGMLAHLVSQRTREIAIRLALGAERRTVVGMVVTRAGQLAAAGVIIGCIVAVLVSRFLSGMVFAVSTTDLTTYLGVAIGALAVALIASWLPARRAAHIEPVTALRLE